MLAPRDVDLSGCCAPHSDPSSGAAGRLSSAGHLTHTQKTVKCLTEFMHKVRFPIAMQCDLRQRYFTSVFPKLVAQPDF
jgi:hypothetical protein